MVVCENLVSTADAIEVQAVVLPDVIRRLDSILDVTGFDDGRPKARSNELVDNNM